MTIHITKEIEVTYDLYLEERVDSFFDGKPIMTAPYSTNRFEGLVDFAAGYSNGYAEGFGKGYAAAPSVSKEQPEPLTAVPTDLVKNIIRIIEDEWGEESETALHLRALLAPQPDRSEEQAEVPSGLTQAAKALVDRWDTPLWKDVEHTGKFIDRLRSELAKQRQAEEPKSEEGD